MLPPPFRTDEPSKAGDLDGVWRDCVDVAGLDSRANDCGGGGVEAAGRGLGTRDSAKEELCKYGDLPNRGGDVAKGDLEFLDGRGLQAEEVI